MASEASFNIDGFADVKQFLATSILIYTTGARCVVKICECLPGNLTHKVELSHIKYLEEENDITSRM